MFFVCQSKILRKHCLHFLLGVKMAPRETENNDKQRALWYVMVFSGAVNCQCKCFAPVRVEIVYMHGRSVHGVHGSRYKQSRAGFMHGYLQSSDLGNKFCMRISVPWRTRSQATRIHTWCIWYIYPGYAMYFSINITQGVVWSILEHRTKIIY